MKLATCVTWVPRGAAAAKPTRVRLQREEMERLLKAGTSVSEFSDIEGDDSDAGEQQKKSQQTGLRGSAKNEYTSDNNEDDFDKRYQFDKYDAEDSLLNRSKIDGEEESESGSDEQESSGAEEETSSGLEGLAMFSSSADDPFLTQPADDSSDDEEDFRIRPDDNLLLVTKIMKDEYGLDVYVYNAPTRDFYVHHDYGLQAPPTSVERIGYDPGAESGGNLAAIATMEGTVEIWDLDLVEAASPVVILGRREQSSKKLKKRKTDEGHSDAALCLSWNQEIEHVLASGGADATIILWDIDAGSAHTTLRGHKNNVQTLQFHPHESAILAAGDTGGALKLWDGRTVNVQVKAKLKDAEVERVLWNERNPFELLVASSSGYVSLRDSRKFTTELWSIEAHDSEVNGLSQHAKNTQCLVTAGDDELVKVWQMSDANSPSLCAQVEVALGTLQCAQFCPDNDEPILAVCGMKGEYVKTLNLSDNKSVKAIFR